MSWSPPFSFIGGSQVEAPELQQTYDSLRKYINRDIAGTDIMNNSVQTTDIVRGEYYNVTRDHQFTTGDLMTQFVETDQFSRSYASSHTKQWNLFSNNFLPIPNTGKRLVLEENAECLYTVSIAPIGDQNYELLGEKRNSAIKLIASYGDRILVTDVIDSTNGFCFQEDNVATDVDGSGNTSLIGAHSRRWYCSRRRLILGAGVWNIGLVVVCDVDKCHFTARNANIEIFYR